MNTALYLCLKRKNIADFFCTSCKRQIKEEYSNIFRGQMEDTKNPISIVFNN